MCLPFLHLGGRLWAIPRLWVPLRRVLGAHAGSRGRVRLWGVLPRRGTPGTPRRLVQVLHLHVLGAL